MSHSHASHKSAVEQFITTVHDSFGRAISVPSSIFNALISVIIFLFRIITFPLRTVQWFVSTFPILTIFLLLSLVLSAFLIKQLTRQRLIQWILHTAVPYCVSFVYTVIGIFFPQVHTVSRVAQMLLHPIRWLLSFFEQVDRRAEPIRRTVEIFAPPKVKKTSSIRPALNRSNSQIEDHYSARVQCVICMNNDKTILLKPCNHLCLCENCHRAIMEQQDIPRCPICRDTIEEYTQVYL